DRRGVVIGRQAPERLVQNNGPTSRHKEHERLGDTLRYPTFRYTRDASESWGRHPDFFRNSWPELHHPLLLAPARQPRSEGAPSCAPRTIAAPEARVRKSLLSSASGMVSASSRITPAAA